MANIFARSPFMIAINEAHQTQTKIELYFRKYGDAWPASPNYTLSKYIPSSNSPETAYNIAPYCREYLSTTTPQNTYTFDDLDTDLYCEVVIYKYADTGSGLNFVDAEQYYVFDGYTEYQEFANYNFNNTKVVLLDQGTYYYNPSDATHQLLLPIFTDSTGTDVNKIKYTDLSGVASPVNVSLNAEDGWKVATLKYILFNKCKTEIINDANAVTHTFYVYPTEECKYTPVRVDFINKYGNWFKLWFYKASNTSVKTESKTYNLLQNWNYDSTQGQTKVFNKTGRKTIKVNSGWLEEGQNTIVEQLMLSERVLVDGLPAILKTESLELQKHINNKQINYSLDFELSYNVLNDIV